jgi:hypothetical protein
LEKPEGPLVVPRRESRRHPRYRFEGVLKIEWGSAVLDALVRDISAEGMQVGLANPLWIGAGFSAELGLDPPVHLACVVRYVQPGQGMGVSIVVPKEADRERFEALLAKLAESSKVAGEK